MPFGVPPLLLLYFYTEQKASCLRTSDVKEFATQHDCTNDIFPMIFKNQFDSKSHPSMDVAFW